jgi:hypothetical protein
MRRMIGAIGQMKERVRECLLVGGVALLFATSQIKPDELGAARFVTFIAIGAVWTLAAALSPEPQ